MLESFLTGIVGGLMVGSVVATFLLYKFFRWDQKTKQRLNQ